MRPTLFFIGDGGKGEYAEMPIALFPRPSSIMIEHDRRHLAFAFAGVLKGLRICPYLGLRLINVPCHFSDF